MPDVTFTVDGKKLTAPAGTLLIDACRKAGIEIPAFCYYPGLSLQAACRMCVVRQEKVPKLQTACTTMVAEGQVFFTATPEVQQARKATLELLLGNHPLDCPVCDAGGECERRVIVPLARPGIATGAILSFAHTMGEFGVVLMVGGNIAGVTRTVSISIYDQVQALRYDAALETSLFLLGFSFVVLALTYSLQRRIWAVWPMN